VKVGDLVIVDYLSGEEKALVLSEPRLSEDCSHDEVLHGTAYEVVEVLLPWGRDLVTTDEVLEVISESRGPS